MRQIILTTLFVFFSLAALAHPTGNIIVVEDNVLWPYINPVQGADHKACVMIWNKDSEPRIFMQSDWPASDFMLFNKGEHIYIIERRYLQATDRFEVRILKSTITTKPKVIWNWFKDDHRIGEGGFFMLSDNKIVFGAYPEVYSLEKGGKPQKYFDFHNKVKRIRLVNNDEILLLGETSCFLVKQDGTIIKQWNDIIDNNVNDAPLNRNQVFDVDYKNGELLLAYWGKRCFVTIDNAGKRNTILQQKALFTPHWVAYLGNKKLLFSSEMPMNGTPPKPYLVLYSKENNKEIIWK